MAPDYVTVYEVSRQSRDWSSLLPGVVALLAGLVVAFGRLRLGWARPQWPVAIAMCGVGVLWLCVVSLTVISEDSRVLSGYRQHDYHLVEGVVTDFQPMPYEGHRDECFSVQNVPFCYSDYTMGIGFKQSASHGGPIRAGLPVRIFYAGDRILRLDIPREDVITGAASAAKSNAEEHAWQQKMERDPLQQRMMTAFLTTMVFWTAWWNIEWRLVMQTWVRPPNPPWVQALFRAFFALNLAGVIWRLWNQMRAHPLGRQEVRPTLEVTAAMCAAVTVMSALGVWQVKRRTQRARG